jgi:hypothetical protein
VVVVVVEEVEELKLGGRCSDGAAIVDAPPDG